MNLEIDFKKISEIGMNYKEPYNLFNAALSGIISTGIDTWDNETVENIFFWLKRYIEFLLDTIEKEVSKNG